MRKIILILVPLFSFVIGWITHSKLIKNKVIESPIENIKQELLRPLDKYTFENLSDSWRDEIPEGKLKIIEEIADEEKYFSYSFIFDFSPTLNEKVVKKTSGQINIPKEGESFPLILMLRGYIDKESFNTGDGTRRAAEFFAENGFIT